MEWVVVVGVIALLVSINNALDNRRQSSSSAKRYLSGSIRSHKRSKSRRASSHRQRTSKPAAPVPARQIRVSWEGGEPEYAAARLKRDQTIFGGSISHRPDKDLPGRVYLVVRGDIHKIGITSTQATTDRILQHQSQGWRLKALWDLPTLSDARAVERQVLAYWRISLGLAAVEVHMPQAGTTETAQLSPAQVESTLERIEDAVRNQSAGRWPSKRIGEVQPGDRVELLARVMGKGQTVQSASVWKVELNDGSGRRITIEFSVGAATEVESVPIGSELQVRGVVQQGGRHLVMTNPSFRLPGIHPDGVWRRPEVMDTWRNASDIVGYYVRSDRRLEYVVRVGTSEVTLLAKRPPPMVGPGVRFHASGRYAARDVFVATKITVDGIGPRPPGSR